MIGFLKGELVAKRPPVLLLDVSGVGYEIEAPMSTFYALPAVGHAVQLVTHLAVREDAHTLYGFMTEAERELFRSLLRVSGIGARIALGILSSSTVDGFYDCVRAKDLAALVRVPGIGRKTGERILVEMADRLPAAGEGGDAMPAAAAGAEGDAQAALLALGYKPTEVIRMLRAVNATGLSAEAMIREALRQAHGH